MMLPIFNAQQTKAISILNTRDEFLSSDVKRFCCFQQDFAGLLGGIKLFDERSIFDAVVQMFAINCSNAIYCQFAGSRSE